MLAQLICPVKINAKKVIITEKRVIELLNFHIDANHFKIEASPETRKIWKKIGVDNCAVQKTTLQFLVKQIAIVLIKEEKQTGNLK